LEVGAAIVSEELVNIKDLAEQLGDPPGTASVNTELKHLEEAGLLERLPRFGSDRRVFLRARPTSYWDTCRDLIAFARERASQAPGRESPSSDKSKDRSR
jgi:hypothetical protein